MHIFQHNLLPKYQDFNSKLVSSDAVFRFQFWLSLRFLKNHRSILTTNSFNRQTFSSFISFILQMQMVLCQFNWSTSNARTQTSRQKMDVKTCFVEAPATELLVVSCAANLNYKRAQFGRCGVQKMEARRIQALYPAFADFLKVI